MRGRLGPPRAVFSGNSPILFILSRGIEPALSGQMEQQSKPGNFESQLSVLIDDAAQRLGVSRRTVYYRIREGRLRTVRTRCGSQRVLCASIEALIREMRPMSAPGASDTIASRRDGLHAQPLTFQVQPLP